ncbi:hypothetical protein F8M41_015624 [Gigaspora margarita]|uniref:BED-type domain-containing protein n=1 Tax=Gigaspora margarita TaxID=4874 RepID=A0A8H4EN28_GIGMA|nr:hypothetical protein F8M41_015624 [Gigaspora margarita]
MNSEQDLDYDYEAYKDYEDDIYKDYEDYEDYEDYAFYNEPLSPTLETNISSPSSTLEINTSTLETNATSTLISETDFISSRKPSPLWIYFKFKPKEPNNPICSKCQFKFSEKSGYSTLENYLNVRHNI